MLIGPFTAEWDKTHDCWVTDCGQHIDLTADEETQKISLRFLRITVDPKGDNSALKAILGAEEFEKILAETIPKNDLKREIAELD